jgi:hypothetical protein
MLEPSLCRIDRQGCLPGVKVRAARLFVGLLGRHTLADAAHDPNHIRRAVTNVRRLTLAEGAAWLVVMAVAWLHDCVAVPKSSPDRRNASRLCARQAVEWLESHLFAKLLTLEGSMQPPGGRVEAGRHTQFIRQFLAQLHDEIGSPEPGPA